MSVRTNGSSSPAGNVRIPPAAESIGCCRISFSRINIIRKKWYRASWTGWLLRTTWTRRTGLPRQPWSCGYCGLYWTGWTSKDSFSPFCIGSWITVRRYLNPADPCSVNSDDPHRVHGFLWLYVPSITPVVFFRRFMPESFHRLCFYLSGVSLYDPRKGGHTDGEHE